MPVAPGMMTRASLVIAAALTISACDRTSTIAPAPIGFQPSFAVGSIGAVIQPLTLVRQAVVGFGCPQLGPFTTSFNVIVQQPRADVFMNEVRLEFFDGFSSHGETIPFLRTDLTSRFGTTLVRAGTTRAFAFSPRFGCFAEAPTLLSAHVSFVDASGTPQETTLSAAIQ